MANYNDHLEITSRKINELMERARKGDKDFTETEKDIFISVDIVSLIEANRMTKFLNESAKSSDLDELVRILKKWGFEDHSMKLYDLLKALKSEGFFDGEGKPKAQVESLTKDTKKKVKGFEKKIVETDFPWDLDKKVYELLEKEEPELIRKYEEEKKTPQYKVNAIKSKLFPFILFLLIMIGLLLFQIFLKSL